MNKFEIPFNLKHSDNHSDRWISERIVTEKLIADWCIENIGPGEFPHWQFSNGQMYFPSFLRNREVDWIIIHGGIFIFKDEDKVAFKLKFKL